MVCWSGVWGFCRAGGPGLGVQGIGFSVKVGNDLGVGNAVRLRCGAGSLRWQGPVWSAIQWTGPIRAEPRCAPARPGPREGSAVYFGYSGWFGEECLGGWVSGFMRVSFRVRVRGSGFRV